MSGPAPVVWLPAATGPAADLGAVETAWAPSAAAVLTPDLRPGSGLVVLEDAGLRVLAALSAAEVTRAVLVGSGYGAMVAMHVAAHFPERVQALVLTSANRLAERTRRSLSNAVISALPLSSVQLLRGQRERVLELLDQVRRVDYAGFVDRVRTPALVVVGQHDVGNFAATRRLAALLPAAELAVAAGAGEGWVVQAPVRLAETAADFLARVGEPDQPR